MNENYLEACALLNQHKLEEAYEMFCSILQQDPSCYRSLNKLGVICARQNNPVKAAEYFHEALRLQPDYAAAIVNLGNQAQEQGDFSTAMDYYTRAIQKDETYHLAYYNLAVTYKSKGDYDQYFKYLKQYKHYYKQHLNSEDREAAARLRSKSLKLSGIAVAILVLFFLLRG
jgi:tetratricopeptide (TPR) repeat protein